MTREGARASDEKESGVREDKSEAGKHWFFLRTLAWIPCKRKSVQICRADDDGRLLSKIFFSTEIFPSITYIV